MQYAATVFHGFSSGWNLGRGNLEGFRPWAGAMSIIGDSRTRGGYEFVFHGDIL